MKVAAIIQARMGSERLPGKVMRKLKGQSILWHIVKRLRHALSVSEIVVATTDNDSDNMIVNQCKLMDVPVFRGSEEDVLNRYYFASKVVKSDYICRITSDNPLVEPGFIDMATARITFSGEDYIAIDGCPLGTGIELFTKEALNIAAEKARKPSDREHVTPYIRNHPDTFRIGYIEVPLSLMYPDLRLTVDTKDDYALLQMIYNRLYREGSIICIHDVIKLMLNEPELIHMNAHVQDRKSVV